MILKKSIKLLIFPLTRSIYLLSGLICRNSDIWVMGAQKNMFVDNTKHFFIYVNENVPQVRAIWISRDKQVLDFLKSKNLEAYNTWSLKGILLMIRAKYWFVTTTTGELNFYCSKNATVINLFHGIPLKKIYFDSDNVEDYNRYHHPSFFQKIVDEPFTYSLSDYVVSSSNNVSMDSYHSALKVPLKNCLPFGLARTDIFFKSNIEFKQWCSKWGSDFLLKILLPRINSSSFVWIYMPTWRETDPNFMNSLGIDYNLINSKLKKTNSLLLLKLHPYTPTTFLNTLDAFSNIIVCPSNEDVYPILRLTNCLITDYSSVYIDYMLMGKQTVFYSFDLDNFQNKARGFYYKYTEKINGPIIKTSSEFESLFDFALDFNDYKINNFNYELESYFFDHVDGCASERLVKFILNKEATINSENI